MKFWFFAQMKAIPKVEPGEFTIEIVYRSLKLKECTIICCVFSFIIFQKLQEIFKCGLFDPLKHDFCSNSSIQNLVVI